MLVASEQIGKPLQPGLFLEQAVFAVVQPPGTPRALPPGLAPERLWRIHRAAIAFVAIGMHQPAADPHHEVESGERDTDK